MNTNKIDNKAEIIEFNSLEEFYNYLVKTPINNAFKNKELSSITGSEEFTKTESFDEAVNLFKNGWTDMANKLVQKLKVIENDVKPMMKPKNTFGVSGYQAIVPLYLQGVPNNMATKKMIPVKQKVVTVNKSINYKCGVTTDQIIEESVKALQIIKKVESQNHRCNLNIVLSTTAGYPKKQFVIKIRIKSANERLNISKVAFPLVHPSMLRRLMFRFIEVYPNVTQHFVRGYGTPAKTDELKKILKGEYVLSNFIPDNMYELE